MVPRAMLSTKSGDLFVFDLEAMAAVLATVSVNQTSLPSLAHQAPSATSSHLQQFPTGKDVIDGFTTQQWVEHAKLKSRIASAMCKENGRLRQQIRSTMRKENADLKPMEESHLVQPEMHVVGDGLHDPLQSSDPWAGTKNPVVEMASEPSTTSMWADFIPTCGGAASCNAPVATDDDDHNDEYIGAEHDNEHKMLKDMPAVGCVEEDAHYKCTEMQYKHMKELDRESGIKMPPAALLSSMATAAHICKMLKDMPAAGCVEEDAHYKCTEVQYKHMRELERDSGIKMPPAALLSSMAAAAHIRRMLKDMPAAGCVEEDAHYECTEMQYKHMKELERDNGIRMPPAALLSSAAAAAHIRSALQGTECEARRLC